MPYKSSSNLSAAYDPLKDLQHSFYPFGKEMRTAEFTTTDYGVHRGTRTG